MVVAQEELARRKRLADISAAEVDPTEIEGLAPPPTPSVRRSQRPPRLETQQPSAPPAPPPAGQIFDPTVQRGEPPQRPPAEQEDPQDQLDRMFAENRAAKKQIQDVTAGRTETFVSEMGEALARDLGSLPEAAIRGVVAERQGEGIFSALNLQPVANKLLGRPLTDDELTTVLADVKDTAAARWIEEVLDFGLGSNPEITMPPGKEDEFDLSRFLNSSVPQGIGSMAGFLAVGAITKGVGRIAGLSTRGSNIAGALGASAQGAPLTGVEQARDIESKGGTNDEIVRGYMFGNIPGLIEGAPILAVFSRLDRGSGGVLSRFLKDGARGRVLKQGALGSLEEGIQETIQAMSTVQISNLLLDLEDPLLQREVAEGGAVGAIVGFLTSAAATAIGGRRGGRGRAGPAARAEAAGGGVTQRVREFVTRSKRKAQEFGVPAGQDAAREADEAVSGDVLFGEEAEPDVEQAEDESDADFLVRRQEQLNAREAERLERESQPAADETPSQRIARENRERTAAAKERKQTAIDAIKRITDNPPNNVQPNTERVATRNRLRVELGRMSGNKRRLAAQLRQVGLTVRKNDTPDDQIERALDAREGLDTMMRFESLAAFDEAVKSGEITPDELQRWAEAVRKGNEGQNSSVNTQMNSSRLHNFGLQVGAFSTPRDRQRQPEAPAAPAAPATVQVEDTTADLPEFARPVEPAGSLEGGTNTLQTKAGRRVRTQYGLADLNAVTTSFDEGFPAALQPRERLTRQSSERQLQRIIENFEPRLLGVDASASSGAPTGNSRGEIMSGNLRTEALRRIQQTRPDLWQKYQDHLRGLGLDPGPTEFLQQTITEAQSAADQQAFAEEANVPDTATLSRTERARSDARSLTGELLALFQGESDFDTIANAPFTSRFLESLEARGETLGDAEQGRGVISKSGIDRIKDALLARALGATDLQVDALTATLEDPGENTKSITDSVIGASAELAGLQIGIEEGRIDPALGEIAPGLSRAIEIMSQLRRERKSVAEFLTTDDILGTPRDPLVDEFLRVFTKPGNTANRSKANMLEIFRAFGREAQRTAESAQGDLIGGDSPIVDLLAAVRQSQDRVEPADDTGGQGTLVTPGGAAVVDPSALVREMQAAMLHIRKTFPAEDFLGPEDAQISEMIALAEKNGIQAALTEWYTLDEAEQKALADFLAQTIDQAGGGGADEALITQDDGPQRVAENQSIEEALAFDASKEDDIQTITNRLLDDHERRTRLSGGDITSDAFLEEQEAIDGSVIQGVADANQEKPSNPVDPFLDDPDTTPFPQYAAYYNIGYRQQIKILIATGERVAAELGDEFGEQITFEPGNVVVPAELPELLAESITEIFVQDGEITRERWNALRDELVLEGFRFVDIVGAAEELPFADQFDVVAGGDPTAFEQFDRLLAEDELSPPAMIERITGPEGPQPAQLQDFDVLARRPFSYTFMGFRGEGGPQTQTPGSGVIGPGLYVALDEKGAKRFGPEVRQLPVTIEEPLVIQSDEEWRALTQQLGWSAPNPGPPPGQPGGQDPAQRERETDALQDFLRANGHDSIAIVWDINEIADVTPKGGIKLLRRVFDAPQVLVLDPSQQPGGGPTSGEEPTGPTEGDTAGVAETEQQPQQPAEPTTTADEQGTAAGENAGQEPAQPGDTQPTGEQPGVTQLPEPQGPVQGTLPINQDNVVQLPGQQEVPLRPGRKFDQAGSAGSNTITSDADTLLAFEEGLDFIEDTVLDSEFFDEFSPSQNLVIESEFLDLYQNGGLGANEAIIAAIDVAAPTEQEGGFSPEQLEDLLAVTIGPERAAVEVADRETIITLAKPPPLVSVLDEPPPVQAEEDPDQPNPEITKPGPQGNVENQTEPHYPQEERANDDTNRIGNALLEERAREAALVAELPMDHPNIAEVAIVFNRELIQTATARIVGQTIVTPKDVATLTQQYRDPRWEVLRYFFVDADGKVLFQTGVSARQPASVNMHPTGNPQWLNDLFDGLKGQAVKVWMVHNHPLSDSKPSESDQLVTVNVANVARAAGMDVEHVVLNDQEYSILDAAGRVTADRRSDETLPTADFMGSPPGKSHALLGEEMENSSAVIERMAKLNQPGTINVISLGARRDVTAIGSFSEDLLISDPKGMLEEIDNWRRQTGAVFVYLSGFPQDQFFPSSTDVFHANLESNDPVANEQFAVWDMFHRKVLMPNIIFDVVDDGGGSGLLSGFMTRPGDTRTRTDTGHDLTFQSPPLNPLHTPAIQLEADVRGATPEAIPDKPSTLDNRNTQNQSLISRMLRDGQPLDTLLRKMFTGAGNVFFDNWVVTNQDGKDPTFRLGGQAFNALRDFIVNATFKADPELQQKEGETDAAFAKREKKGPGVTQRAINGGFENSYVSKSFEFVNVWANRARNSLIDRFNITEEFKATDTERARQRLEIVEQGIGLVQQLNAMGATDPNEQVLIHRYLSGEASEKSISDKEWAAVARETRATLDYLGLEAVNLGMISMESYQRNRGTWMHRSYLEKEGFFVEDPNELRSWIGKLLRGDRADAPTSPGGGVSRAGKIIGDAFMGRGIFLEHDQRRLLRDMPADVENIFGGNRAFTRNKDGSPDNSMIGKEFQIFDVIEDFNRKQQRIPGVPDAEKGHRIKRRVFWPADQEVPASFGNYEYRGKFVVRRPGKDNKMVLWRDFTKEERAQMGEIMDARYNMIKSFELLGRDLSNGKFFRAIARNAEWTWDRNATGMEEPPEEVRATVKPSIFGIDSKVKFGRSKAALETHGYSDDEWVQVPTGDIKGTAGVSKWGDLAGKWVKAEIWRDLSQMEEMYKSGPWAKVLREWKLNKTARNPVVHMNNVISNVVLMDLLDVRMQDLFEGFMVRMAPIVLRSNKPGMKELHGFFKGFENKELLADISRHGGFGHSIIDIEMTSDVLTPIMKQIQKSLREDGSIDDGFFNKLRLINAISAAWNSQTAAYRIEDEIFRTATVIRKQQQGYTMVDAAKIAREQFLDYDIRAPGINAARRSVFPFIGYTYRAVPVLAEAMMKRPWKLAKYSILGEVANALAYAISDGDEEYERGSFRDEVQGDISFGPVPSIGGVPRMMRMPTNDEFGRPQFLDIRRYMPAGDVYDLVGNNPLPIPVWMQVSGPLMIAAELALNRSAFTGNDIVDDLTDSTGDKWAKYSQWLWQSVVPSAPWIPMSWYNDKIFDLDAGPPFLSEGTDRRGRADSTTQRVMQSFGVKVTSQDPVQGYTWKAQEYDNTRRGYLARINQARRRFRRKMMSPEAFGREVADIQNRLRILQKNKALALAPFTARQSGQEPSEVREQIENAFEEPPG